MAELLNQALSEQGYTCVVATNGVAGLKKASGCDLLLVDVLMPVMNGFSMVEKLREQGNRAPVIFITAKDSTKDIVRGLEVGGDDYLVKPFVLDVLIARVKAALRRSQDSNSVLTWNDFAVDRTRRVAYRADIELFLSATEFALLELFVINAGTILSKAAILERVWHDDGYRGENIVETYVTYLRRKTEAHGLARVIQTVRGRGYVLTLAKLEP